MKMKTTKDFVFFWTAKDDYSNFFFAPFTHQGKSFQWAEQAIMYRKAKLFGAHKIAERVLEAKDPATCKSLGRSREIPFDNKIWDENKERIFKEILHDKFKLPDLRIKMLNTGSREFAEASPYDKIWGIGMRESHPDATIKSKWKGDNLLGKILTEVRNEIQEEYAKIHPAE